MHLRDEGAPHYVDVTSSVSLSLLIISFYPFIAVLFKMKLKSAETQFYATRRYITYKCSKIIIKRIANGNESTTHSLGQL